jgi:hypothetical protein
MTDLHVFMKFMEWMGMTLTTTKDLGDGNTLYVYDDPDVDTEMFTTLGYNCFDAAIIVDGNGTMIKGFLDSHVAHISENCKYVYSLLEIKLPNGPMGSQR